MPVAEGDVRVRPAMGSRHEELLACISEQEARLAELDRQRDQARLELENLRRLSTVTSRPVPS